MSIALRDVAEWWLGTLAVGGALLLVVRVVMPRIADPSARQRLGECGAVAALLVAVLRVLPAWLPLALPSGPPVAVAVVAEPESAQAMEYIVEPTSTVIEEATPAFAVPFDWRPVAWTAGGGLFVAVAVVGTGRALLGAWGLQRLRGAARPARRTVARLFYRLRRRGMRRAGLGVSSRLTSPVCFGLARPTVLLPEAVESADAATLRYVFAHELAHLRRGDPLSRWALSWTAAVYWPLPWFWGVSRQVRLCQEFVADATASATGQADEYATVLLRLAQPGVRVAGALGVVGSKSDLYRRVQMIVQPNRSDNGRSRRWALLASLSVVAAAVALSGLGVRAETPKAEERRNVIIIKQADEDPTKPPITFTYHADGDEKAIRAMIEQLQAKIADLRTTQERDLAKLQAEIAARMAKMAELKKGEAAKADGHHDQAVELRNERLNVVRDMHRLMDAQQKLAIDGRGSHPRFGAQIEAPTPAIADQLDLPKGQGIVLSAILPDSPAAKAGFKPHDILLELAGKPVSSSVPQFLEQIGAIKTGDKVEAVVLRKGRKETINDLTLPDAPKNKLFSAVAGPMRVEAALAPTAPLPPTPPALPAPAIAPTPSMPALPGVPVPGKPGVTLWTGTFASPQPGHTSIKVMHSNVDATTRDGKLSISLQGELVDGKLIVKQISVSEADLSITENSINRLPKGFRPKVEAFQKQIEERLQGLGAKTKVEGDKTLEPNRTDKKFDATGAGAKRAEVDADRSFFEYKIRATETPKKDAPNDQGPKSGETKQSD